ncbi:IS200/IS605 family transposase [Candidatus Laterigemmans baculatus]|uniref:IS200/IS605 family transposase n=1 Tax=Candidatus Laterigemmans baculatus TaxID=2770505 RepID=UPI0013D99E9E|nr:IS200/IS605 family transposase [Candidatus Laterigemmans baculatus]
MANTFTSLSYHVVFSTKYRYRMISDQLAPELYKYVGGILREHNSQPVEINGVEDHIHILTSIAPTIAVSDLARTVKANSSKWVRENHARKFAWQNGYAAFTVSISQLETVRRYVANQHEHHRKMSFREEYLTLLQKHRIRYEEKYVFDEEHLG